MIVVAIIIFALLFSLSIYLGWLNSPAMKGKRGELQVSAILSQLPEEYILLDDLVFKTAKGTTQIDHVVLSKYGVFVIETKNYLGNIYGDDNRTHWTQLIVTDVTYRKSWNTYTYVTKNRFYSPVKQSYAHVGILKELLRGYPYLPVVPVVVFIGKADISNVNSRHHIIKEQQLLPLIAGYREVRLNDQGLLTVKNIIQKNNIRNLVDNKTHIRNIEEIMKADMEAISSGKCPKCGGNLILRNGKYGSFYGCSNYPKCKFTKNN